jgi:hypothetical protein
MSQIFVFPTDPEERDLATQTAKAFKLKLSNQLSLPGVEGKIPVSYSRPEEWLVKRTKPSVNISTTMMKFDPTRFTTASIQAWLDDTYETVQIKPYYMPVIFFYEVRFIVSYGQHMMSLSDQILRKLPPFGFGTFVTIPYGDTNFTLPFELQTDKELLARYGDTEDNREFEKVLQYKVEGWLDLSEVQLVSTVKSLALTTDVSGFEIQTTHDLTK